MGRPNLINYLGNELKKLKAERTKRTKELKSLNDRISVVTRELAIAKEPEVFDLAKAREQGLRRRAIKPKPATKPKVKPAKK